jgi:2-polyprenyl-3-methyl-5-hydroxy-6-metoxy-1,4-benzoquinol methylase
MKEIYCPICGPESPYKVLYPEKFNHSDLEFVARKTPDHMHFRIVKCRSCGLVYSNPIIAPEHILHLYRTSEFICEAQLKNMSKDYLEQFEKVLKFVNKGNLLEIGCANGFFLEKVKQLGFQNVSGIEPGIQAVSKASDHIRSAIVIDELKPGLFPENSFDVICFFQVFDHIVDPNEFLQIVHDYLKPGGVLFAIHHNIRALMPTLLRSKSSTYDISHIHLWDKKTMRLILEKNHFDVLSIKDISSRYQIDHILRMLPLPSLVKKLLRNFCHRIKIDDYSIRICVENMSIVARKPY